MAKRKSTVPARRRRRSTGLMRGVGAVVRPKWIAVGFAVEQLGTTIAGFFPSDASGVLAKLKRSPTGVGLIAAGYFLKSPDVCSVGMGMVGSAVTAS